MEGRRGTHTSSSAGFSEAVPRESGFVSLGRCMPLRGTTLMFAASGSM